MRQFVSYEEENIHYWTHRAPGYSGVNQEELATDQKRVWGRAIGERIAARFPGRGPESIRVLVTRNVTWNLPNPEKAYGHWTRVLAHGGLLLNFDANWYRYLWDEKASLGHKQDRENLAVSDVRDENAGTDVDAMEAIARQTPLSRQQRPQWDLSVLAGLGIHANADEHIWQRVWTREERINNSSTPMFLVEGWKPRLLEN